MARGRLRVVAGSAGGLRLESPPGDRTRPTTERVREAVFSALGDAVASASVLDLYAGTGAMAIEALSRGAARAVLVEHDRQVAAVARRNLTHTGFERRARVVEAPVARFLDGARPPEAPFTLVCADPPYDTPDAEVADVLARLEGAGWLAAGARVVVERPAGGANPSFVPSHWQHRFARTYGDTLVHLVSTGEGDPPT